MTRAEPSSIIASLANRHTTQVSADTQHHKPLWLLRPRLVAFRIPKCLPILRTRFVNFTLRPVSDEHGFTAPFDDDVLALGDVAERDFDFGEGEDVGGGGHGAEELGDGRLGDGGGEHTHGADHEVGDRAVGR